MKNFENELGSPIRSNITILNLAEKEHLSKYIDVERIETIFKEKAVECVNTSPEIWKINTRIHLMWTGFQLVNQTHFGNDQNQFIQGKLFQTISGYSNQSKN